LRFRERRRRGFDWETLSKRKEKLKIHWREGKFFERINLQKRDNLLVAFIVNERRRKSGGVEILCHWKKGKFICLNSVSFNNTKIKSII